MAEEKIKIVRVDDAAFFIEDLFKRTFNAVPPTVPVHYVALYRSGPSTFEAVGYNHATYCDEYILTGGLCVDPRYRNQGIGEKLQQIVFEDPGEKKAFFGYAGNLHLALRVGYVTTRQKHLVVKWVKPLPEEEKERLIAQAAALEPF